jgi:opacity protein-like surface antigen
MKRISFAIAAVAILAATASTSSAQSNKAVSIGISGGASIPVGDFGDLYTTGWNGTGSLMFRSLGSPLGIRIDGMYNRLSVKDDVIGVPFDNVSIASANANLVYNLQGTGITPYLIGGAGAYWLQGHGNGFNGDSQSKLGVNGGIGASFQLSGFNTFIEARYHHVFTDENATQFIPVTFGISF